jgi:DNA modification methylase
VLDILLKEGQTWGDCSEWLPALPSESVDLWFTSPPYADARAYSRIHPDRYVDWFLPHGKLMLAATTDTGWLVLNIKNRVASTGALRGQRHPYVYELVVALQQQGWRWLETYIWSKPNAVPGRVIVKTCGSRSFRWTPFVLCRPQRRGFILVAAGARRPGRRVSSSGGAVRG